MFSGHQEVDHVRSREYLVAIGGNGRCRFCVAASNALEKGLGVQMTRRGAEERSDHV